MTGIMFPGVTEVKITRKSDGVSVVVNHADLKAKLKPDDFDRLSHDVFMMGEFEDSVHKVTIHTQEKDYDIKHTIV